MDIPALQTALREAQEEIGLAPETVRLLGYLEPMVTITGYRVYPVVAAIDPDYRAEPDGHEVSALFEAPLAVALPGSSDEVAALVRFCAAHRIAIVPQGGNTSTCGAATPDDSGRQLVIALRRLNRIRAVDAANQTITVEAGKVTLIDIREPDEHATGVANGARLLPMSQLNQRAGEIPKDPTQPVLIICNTQNRSSKVVQAMQEAGWTNVRYVHGGMSTWAKNGWHMVKPFGLPAS